MLLALLVPLGQGRCDAFSLSPPPVTSFLFAVSLSGFACWSVICFLFVFRCVLRIEESRSRAKAVRVDLCEQLERERERVCVCVCVRSLATLHYC